MLVASVIEIDQGRHRFFFQRIDIEVADNPADCTCLFWIPGQDILEGFVIPADQLADRVFTGRDQYVRISPVYVDCLVIFLHGFPGSQSLVDL